MKTILVDAWNTFVKNNTIDSDIYKILESYENQKIILTNANDKELISLGIVNMPYKVFSLSHNPNKDNKLYFIKLIEKYNLINSDLVYIEHNKEAVKSAISLGIKTHHYKPQESTDELSQFLLKNL
jgi:FMN phosphatase YigB (HAD superfamily)